MVGIRAVPWLIGLFVLGASLATRVGTHESGAAVSSTLHGSVGPGFVISLTYDDGTAVLAPPPGTYKILVDDLAPDHNFHLLGPGVDLSTGTEQVGSVTWTATFQNNSSYVFQCDTHAAEMTGMFVVGHPASTTTGPTASPTTTLNSGHPTPIVGTLASSVSSTAATLVSGGKRVSLLKAGMYRLTITDSSRTAGFELQRVGFAATSLTSAAFAGKHTVVVNLKAGKWKYFSSKRAASAVVFSVTAK
jgi:hypothetical protein